MRWIPTVKIGLLVVLVSASIVLSDELWTMGWGTSGEVSFVPDSTPIQAEVPTEKQIMVPYRIVLRNRVSNLTTVDIPGTSDYQDWLKSLGAVHVLNLHSINSLSERDLYRAVRFDFGTDLPYQNLTQWVPGLEPSVLPKDASTVYLYQETNGGPVMLAMASQSGIQVGQTDLSPSDFSARIRKATLLQPWAVWGTQTKSYVPVNGFSMFTMQATVKNQSVLPLVHSFFVNTQALTSVQENKNTLLWTDGSRAVWWDQQAGVLTYADPNTTSTQTNKQFTFGALLNFVSAHGGASTDSILVDNSSTTGELQWTLQPYLYGFPILTPQFSVSTTAVGNQVTQFQTPVSTITPGDRTLVHVMGSDALKKILLQLAPTTSYDALTVQLGYMVESAGKNTYVIEPAYEVSQSGITLWEIDAVTGQVVKGMKFS